MGQVCRRVCQMEWSGLESMKQHASSQVTLRWFCPLSVSVQTYRLTDLQQMGEGRFVALQKIFNFACVFCDMNLCRLWTPFVSPWTQVTWMKSRFNVDVVSHVDENQTTCMMVNFRFKCNLWRNFIIWSISSMLIISAGWWYISSEPPCCPFHQYCHFSFMKFMSVLV
jgi:hypothetical protein